MKKNINAKTEEILISKMRYISKNEGLSYPQAVTTAIHEYITRYEKIHGRIKDEDILQMELFL